MSPDSFRRRNPGVKLTYDDFVLFPDDGRRHELIDGEHYVTPSPNRKHQKVSGQLHLLIGTWLEQHPVGQVYYAPFDVVFSRFDVVEPDLLYMSNERAAQVLTAANVQGAPELVVNRLPQHTCTGRDDQASPLRACERGRVLGRGP